MILGIDLRKVNEMNEFKQIGFGDLKHKTAEELRGAVIVGFDIDWASDFVLEDALQLASDCGIQPTLFVTHGSSLVHNLFKEKNYDFGLHPNFEKLLNGDDSNGIDARDVLQRLIHEFPGVDVVRSHCLTTSSKLKVLFKENNLSVESSFITHGTQSTFPNFWNEWTGVVQVPITWEDDVWFTLEEGEAGAHPERILRRDRLNVLTFHPIHLYMNTTDTHHYQSSKYASQDQKELTKHRKNEEFGVRNIFRNVAKAMAG